MAVPVPVLETAPVRLMVAPESVKEKDLVVATEIVLTPTVPALSVRVTLFGDVEEMLVAVVLTALPG